LKVEIYINFYESLKATCELQKLLLLVLRDQQNFKDLSLV